MSQTTSPITFSSKEELYENLDKVLDDFRGFGVSVIRGLNLSREEQHQLVQDLGDIIGWFPNNQSVEVLHKYQENHSSNYYLEDSEPDEIILDWHLEHVDYDSYVPLIGGVWNMFNFKANPNSGMTYFLDSCEAYKLFSREEIDFFSKCTLTWSDVNGSGPHYAPVIVSHWLTKNPLIRIEITKEVLPVISEFDGRKPTEEEQLRMLELKSKFHDIVDNNEDLRIIHKWQEGDIVIPDLQRMAHAVTGGFNSSDREFIGVWLFSVNPEGREEEDMPIVWRRSWWEKN